jgi:hypothetical protein
LSAAHSAEGKSASRIRPERKFAILMAEGSPFRAAGTSPCFQKAIVRKLVML